MDKNTRIPGWIKEVVAKKEPRAIDYLISIYEDKQSAKDKDSIDEYYGDNVADCHKFLKQTEAEYKKKNMPFFYRIEKIVRVDDPNSLDDKYTTVEKNF